MKPSAIHQFVAGFRNGDAITNAALLLRRHLRAWGVQSEIFGPLQRIAPQMRAEARDLGAAALNPHDIAILHLSIGTPVNRHFAALRCRKAIIYHNITPAHYFTRLNPALAADLAEGRRQAQALCDAAEVNLADSAYNAAELQAMGYRNVQVLPLPIDIAAYAPTQGDPATLRQLRDGHTNVLFVGRMVPNKRFEDILYVMHHLQRRILPEARFVHVGSSAGVEVYQSLLLAQVRALPLTDTLLMGHISPAGLNACYATADLFLCLSEHEGFCAPLIEAMLHDVPVVARAAAAVPETLAGAGVLLHTRDHATIAEAVGRVLGDAALRQAIIARQRQRLTALRQRDLDGELRTALAPLL